MGLTPSPGQLIPALWPPEIFPPGPRFPRNKSRWSRAGFFQDALACTGRWGLPASGLPAACPVLSWEPFGCFQFGAQYARVCLCRMVFPMLAVPLWRALSLKGVSVRRSDVLWEGLQGRWLAPLRGAPGGFIARTFTVMTVFMVSDFV